MSGPLSGRDRGAADEREAFADWRRERMSDESMAPQ